MSTTADETTNRSEALIATTANVTKPGRPAGPNVDPEHVAEALIKNRGMVYLAAEALKIDPGTIQRYA